uniref:Mediator of RNA polymerase II transcription subunit 15 n=1 Tax=Steinernema glaseri TaxID=37863 RepID=A0A1I7YVJ7_9BILA
MQQQQQKHMMMAPPNTTSMQQFANMPPTSSTSNIDDLYAEDFLPTPMEPTGQQGGMGSISSFSSSNSTSGTMMNLCDSARIELEGLNDRFLADTNTDIIADHVIVKCTMRHRSELPSLRLVIPRNYPQANVTIERVPLDLDSFYYDDLQNAVYDNFSKMTVRTITEALSTWQDDRQDDHRGFEHLGKRTPSAPTTCTSPTST